MEPLSLWSFGVDQPSQTDLVYISWTKMNIVELACEQQEVHE